MTFFKDLDPEILARGVAEGWADPEVDPKMIEDWPDRIARALIPFALDGGGRPMCPIDPEIYGQPIRYGRWGLGRWGENSMADALVTCEVDGRPYVLLIQRKDDLTWAMPGGSIEPGEYPVRASIRECYEETGLNFMDQVPDRVLADLPRWVNDPRGSMEAWAVTVVTRFDLGELDKLPEVRGESDAQCAMWWPVRDIRPLIAARMIFPAHREILAGLS